MFAIKSQVKMLDRLQKRSDFLWVQRGGRKWVSQSLILQIRENGDKGRRFGITVTKKISKSAVTRNRIKRRLRAVARDVLPVNGPENMDFVLIGRRETETRPYDVLCRDLRWCLRRLAEAGKEEGAGNGQSS